MIPILALMISGIQAMVAAVNWRNGLLLVLLVGALQDPFRKMAPGIPAYYVMWAAALFILVFASAWLGRSLGRMRYLALNDRRLAAAGRLLGLVLLVHAMHSLVRWGNPAIPVLGAMLYLAPLIGVWVGMAYARTETDIRRFLGFYAVLYTAAALTVYLSPDYKDAYPVLQEIGAFVGRELKIYDVGTMLYSYSGIFRVGEIAAWHAATAAVFWIILALRNPNIAFRVLVAALVVALVGVIVLTGRRKMLMALTLFVVLFIGLLVLMRGGGGRLVVPLMLVGIVGSFGFQLFEKDQHSSMYMERSVGVFSEVGERFATALNLMRSATYRSGGVGLGLGVASQGGRYGGGGGASVGGSSEAGIGLVVVEIGILGFVLLLWVLWRLARRIWSLLFAVGNRSPVVQLYGAAISAFLVANLATFTVATQLFGDPLVLMIIGLTAGFLFRVLWEGIAISQTARHRHATSVPIESNA